MSLSQSENNLRSRLYKRNDPDAEIKTVKGKFGSGLIPKIARKGTKKNTSKLPPITFDKGSIHLSQLFENYSAIPKKSTMMNSGSSMNSKFFKERGVLGSPQNKSRILPSIFENDQSVLYQKSPKDVVKPSKNYLSPLDFIQLVRDDPEMSDEFCYLRKRDDPYDWEIIQFDKICDKDVKGPSHQIKLKEYMTISSRGITHFVDEEAYFIELDEWEREYKLYTELKKIKFFYYYKKWKNFNLWRKLRRRTEFKKRRQFLENNMFLIDNKLQDPLLQIRDICCTIKNEQNVLQLPTKEAADIATFKEYQIQHVLEQKSEIDYHINDEIKHILEASCKQSLDAFKEENRIRNRDNDDADNDEQGPPLLVGDETNKEMPYTQEATIRTHYKKLKKFIKLVDYLILDSKLSLMNNSMFKASEYLEGNLEILESNKKGSSVPTIINVNASIEKASIFYNPDISKIKKIFEDIIIYGVQNVCGEHAMLIKAPEFNTYVNVGEAIDEDEDSPIDTYNLVAKDPIFSGFRDQIAVYLEKIFGHLMKKSEDLSEILEIVVRANQFTETEIDGMVRSDVQKMIDQFITDDDIISRLIEKIEIGLYNFDRTELRANIEDIAQKCLDRISAYFPKHMEGLYNKYCDSIQEMMDLLCKPTQEVSQFIEHMDNYERCKEEYEVSNKEYTTIIDLHNIFNNETYPIKMNESTKKAFNDVKNIKDDMRKLLEDIEGKMDNERNRNKKELTNLVPILESELETLQFQVKTFNLNKSTHDPEDIQEEIVKFVEKAQKLHHTAKSYKQFHDKLDMKPNDVKPFDSYEKELRSYQAYWKMKLEWTKQLEEYLYTPVKHLLWLDMEDKMKENLNICYTLLKEIEDNEMFSTFLEEMINFEAVIIIVRSLQEKALKESDWEAIKSLLHEDENINFSDFYFKDDEFTLMTVNDLEMKKYYEQISEISVRASKEEGLLENLNKITDFLSDKSTAGIILVEQYKESNDVYVLASNEDLIKILDSMIVLATNILSSRYVHGIRKQVLVEKKRLDYYQELLDEWFACQRSWKYLEPIFNGDDTANKELIKEKKQFKKNVYLEFVALTKECHGNFQLIRKKIRKEDKSLMSKIKQIREELDYLERKLISYLESKRVNFPRFYFISNDDLIEILSSGKGIEVLQPHLPKLFEAIKYLEVDEGETSIVAMISPEAEKVDFINPLVSGSNESMNELLKNIEKTMTENVRLMINRAADNLAESTNDRVGWIMRFPAQAILACDSYIWTKGVESCLKDEIAPLAELEDWYNSQMDELEEVIVKVKEDLPKDKRKLINALITQDVHYRDITDELGTNQITNHKDFEWSKQLRFYYSPTNDIVGRQVSSEIKYGYEYLGVPSKLAITPLTDRCWMTITGALYIHLGCAPVGPAGTGKTESTKDLAKNLGMLCIVYNCSEQVTVGIMKSLFLGIIYTGAWLCLDEFNRIDIEVLSVIAQQVLAMKIALTVDPKQFIFHGTPINTERFTGIGVFTTMNPGYAGRTELPDNLKVLFRPVSMMVPDYSMIAEILLYSEGFINSGELAGKLTKLYRLASEQLSQQRHYDFGMRAVKSILSMAGNLKRHADDDADEDLLLIQAMKDVNIPKFLDDDIRLFNAIVQDLFPGKIFERPPDSHLIEALNLVLKKDHMQSIPAFIEKCVQFHEIQKIRFGSMLIGPPMTGKTSVLQMIRKAYNYLSITGVDKSYYMPVNCVVLNPKSITMGELLGESDPISGDFKNGIASNYFAEFAEDVKNTKKWIVFDGPVDSLWIENLNSVLDDSMTLCLSNGKRIKLKDDIRVFFEAQDLNEASPATVSRVGMVYLDDGVIPPLEMAKTIFHREFTAAEGGDPIYIDERHKTFFFDRIGIIFPQLAEFIRKHCNEPIPTKDNNLITSLIRVWKAVYTTDFDRKKVTVETEDSILYKMLIFSVTWGVCCTCDRLTSEKLEKLANNLFPTAELPIGELGDSFLDFSQDPPDWMPWESLDLSFEYKLDSKFSNIIVPTQNTKKYEFLLRKAIHCKYPVYLSGATGTGKTIIVKATLENLSKEDKIIPLEMTFSAKTTSSLVQNQITSKMSNIRKEEETALGVKKIVQLVPTNPSKTLVVFVDDINMPETEQYGAQPPIELLRQAIDSEGFYDRHALQWRNLTQTVFIAASVNPGGGRSQLTQRFTRHFQLINIHSSGDGVMMQIFGSLIKKFFLNYEFDEAITKMDEKLVAGTLKLYHQMSDTMLPTPSKSHYTFNLRDVSKVFKGMVNMRPEHFENTTMVSKLWIHECERIFGDRLNTDKDRATFFEYLAEISTVHVGFSITKEEIISNKVIFGDFCNETTRELEELPSLNDIRKQIQIYMLRTPLRIELFTEAVYHLCKISRILYQDRDNVLLIGIGGTGKKSLTAVAASMSGAILMQIEPSKNYSLNDFREEVFNKMLYTSGVLGKKVCFLFTDTHVIHESFLEDINNLINTGEMEISKDNLDRLKKDIADDMKNENYLGTEMEFYVARVRQHLNIVLAMSPVGESLRTRLRNFPSFVNNCTINWIDTWPEEALRSISKKTITEDMKSKGYEVELLEKVVESSIAVHNTSFKTSDTYFEMYKRRVYITPKNFLDLLKLFQEMTVEFKGGIEREMRKLSIGLTKLKESNKEVAALQEELTKLQPILQQKTIDQNILIQKLEKDRSIANDQKERVEEEAMEVKEKADEIQFILKEANDKVAEAEPKLAEAAASLDSLDRGSISEFKMLKSGGIKSDLLECVHIILGVPHSENQMKKTLADAMFLTKLKTVIKEIESLSKQSIAKLKKKISSNKDLTFQNVTRITVAGASIFKWIEAVRDSFGVFEEVGELKSRAAEFQAEFDKQNAELQQKQDELDKVLAKVKLLEDEYEENRKQKEELDQEITATQTKLENAEKLTVGLADEAIRWEKTLEKLSNSVQFVFGDSFLTAACVAYQGPFPGSIRAQMLLAWQDTLKEQQILFSDDFALNEIAVDIPTIRKWNVCGLPSNPVSVCNGILVARAESFPYMIDPQLQANKWIKKLEASRDLIIIKASQEDKMAMVIENAVKNGTPVLIEDSLEHFPPFIDRLLLKQFIVEGGMKSIQIGDSLVEYDDGFALYYTSKLSNPKFLPEAFIRVSVVNFTVTEDGLEEQLLAELILKILPEMEAERIRLLMSIAEGEAQLRKNENTILSLLSDSGEVNILENTPLILNLEQSKKKSNEVQINLEKNEKAQTVIKETREKYKTVATRGSQIYFVICDLAMVDPMYQFSLIYFTRLFQNTIDSIRSKLDKLENEKEKCDLLIESITATIFLNICRGLFNDHKKLFAFLLTVKIEMGFKQIHAPEWDLLLKGIPLGIDIDIPAMPQLFNFEETGWKKFLYYLQILGEKGIELKTLILKDNSFVAELNRWANGDMPFDDPIPRNFDEKLSDFQKLLMVQQFRPDCTLISIISYIENILGSLYVSNDAPILDEVFRDTDCKTPMIFVLSPGSDPLQNVQKFATSLDEKLNALSLGQGQGIAAARMIKLARVTGEWVLLQNCHLSKTFMPELETIIESFKEMELREEIDVPVNNAPQQAINVEPNGEDQAKKEAEGNQVEAAEIATTFMREITDTELNSNLIHPKFRLLLTSTPCDYFPITILQNGVKLTNEPPKGIRSNLLKIYNEFDKDILGSCEKQPETFKKLLYAVSMFHAVVLERRKFGALGWNIYYDFNDSDLETSVEVLRNMLNEGEEVSYNALKYLTAEINYGGRVTDDWDRRTLNTIMDVFFNESVLNEPDYEFTKSPDYRVVQYEKISSYIDYFREDIPELDSPEIFGMDPKAEIAYQIKESQKMLEIVLGLQPKDSVKVEGEISNDDKVIEFVEILKEEFPNLILKEGQKKPEIKHFNDPLEVCVVQEVERFNRLISEMSSSLDILVKAIRGEAIMSDDLDKMFHSFLNNQVPEIWTHYGYPSLKNLGDWYKDFNERVKFFRIWYMSSSRPHCYKLNAFYFPQGFLTSVLQDHSRKSGIAIDQLNFKFEFKATDPSTLTAGPENGCYIDGLLMEGARYDLQKSSLVSSEIDAPMYEPSPMIHFNPEKDYKPPKDLYAMPLYKTILRKGALSPTGHSTNFVLTIYCPTKEDPVTWVLNGAAFICA